MDNYEQITGDNISGIKPDYQEIMKVFLTSINEFVDELNIKITSEVSTTLNTDKKTALCNLIRKDGNKNFFNLMGNNSEEDGYFEYLKVYLAGGEGEEGEKVANVMKDFYINGDNAAFLNWFESYKNKENRKYIEWADKIIEHHCPTPIELTVKEIRQDGNDDIVRDTNFIYNLTSKDKEIKIKFQGKTNSSININYKKLEIKDLIKTQDYEQNNDHILIKSNYIQKQNDNKEFTLIFDPDIYKKITLKFKTPPAAVDQPTVNPASNNQPIVNPPVVASVQKATLKIDTVEQTDKPAKKKDNNDTTIIDVVKSDVLKITFKEITAELLAEAGLEIDGKSAGEDTYKTEGNIVILQVPILNSTTDASKLIKFSSINNKFMNTNITITFKSDDTPPSPEQKTLVIKSVSQGTLKETLKETDIIDVQKATDLKIGFEPPEGYPNFLDSMIASEGEKYTKINAQEILIESQELIKMYDIAKNSDNEYYITFESNNKQFADTDVIIKFSDNQIPAQSPASPTVVVPVKKPVAAPPLKSSDASLKSLTISNGNLNPSEFKKETTAYTVNVESDIKKITVTAEAFNSKSRIMVTSGDQSMTSEGASEGVSHDIVLHDTESTNITVEVIAEDSTKKTYTITVGKVETQPAPASSPAAPAPVVAEVPDNVIKLGGCRFEDSDELQLLMTGGGGPLPKSGPKKGTFDKINFNGVDYKSTDLIAYMQLERGTDVYEYLCLKTKNEPANDGTYKCTSFSRDSNETNKIDFKLTYDNKKKIILHINSLINVQNDDKIRFRNICINISDMKDINDKTKLHIIYDNQSEVHGKIRVLTSYNYINGTCLVIGGMDGIEIEIEIETE